MAFDFKKEYKEFYMPADKPSIVAVPPVNYIAVRGSGDTDQCHGDVSQRGGNDVRGVGYYVSLHKI